jgi:hypothetical protein
VGLGLVLKSMIEMMFQMKENHQTIHRLRSRQEISKINPISLYLQLLCVLIEKSLFFP